MSAPDLKHLFTPGTGVVPPYLAGRREEQDWFQDAVEALRDRKPISRDLILYGPRGNGKTALLHYLQEETLQKEGDRLDILWATPDEMRTQADLSDRLTEDHTPLHRRVKSVEVSGGVGFLQGKTEVDLSRPDATVRRLLQQRSQHRPFILIIDEAHELDPQIAGALLNASQIVRSEGHPFLLVLAGTPNLGAALGQANASFWDRSKKFPLGRLSAQEARQALTIPLHEAGITFAPGVVEHIVGQAHCYPFFLQVWGDCLARRLDQTKATQITLTQVREVKGAVIDERDAMYDIRRDEIEEMGLLPVAEHVADAFLQSNQPVQHKNTLEQAIERGLVGDDESITPDRIRDKVKQLSHLGYVWKIKGSSFEPGIPSLMAYVKRYALPPTYTAEVEPGVAPSPSGQAHRWRANRKVQDTDIEM